MLFNLQRKVQKNAKSKQNFFFDFVMHRLIDLVELSKNMSHVTRTDAGNFDEYCSNGELADDDNN